MLSELIEYMEQKKIISVYTYGNTDNFSLGFIDTMDKNFIRIRTLSNDGIYLGYEIIKIDTISRVDLNSIYEKKIQFLADNFKGNYSEITLPSDNIEDTVIIDILKESKKNKIVLSLSFKENSTNDIVGIVNKISSKTVSIISLDDYGQEIENTVICVDDILSIECGEKRLQVIQCLIDNNFRL